MKTRKKLEDENAEKIIQLFELGAALNWFSLETTDLKIEDFLEDDSNRDNK